jgi:transposase InsO family protein
MMDSKHKSASRKWSEFKFSVIGWLLAAPPGHGELVDTLKLLSEKKWQHPTNGEDRVFSFSTIERWYYQALNNKNTPMESLARGMRSDSGKNRSIPEEVKVLIQDQYRDHKSWSYQLHWDNVKVLLEEKKQRVPSYDSLRRYLQSIGYVKKRRDPNGRRAGFQKSAIYKDKVEVRSYENGYVNGLWHLDFHHCSREIMTRHGELIKPLALAVIDDHSRLLCHIQWYLSETAEVLIHGFLQALQKRGLPRSLLTDNGSAMISYEFTNGLKKLDIIHDRTLPYSPYQNGKQEVLWGQVEGRLLAMLENKKILTLKELNDATVSWGEFEYNKKPHTEIKMTPLERFLRGQDVGRPAPELDILKRAFRLEANRTLRKSDCTISIKGKRFEIPSRYGHFKEITVAYVQWSLDNVHMVDPKSGKILCQVYPVNKTANANNGRKLRESAPGVFEASQNKEPCDEVAPLLLKILGDQAATGLPPAYQPKD